MADVATTKLLENDKIIVWELVLEPGEYRVSAYIRDNRTGKMSKTSYPLELPPNAPQLDLIAGRITTNDGEVVSNFDALCEALRGDPLRDELLDLEA